MSACFFGILLGPFFTFPERMTSLYTPTTSGCLCTKLYPGVDPGNLHTVDLLEIIPNVKFCHSAGTQRGIITQDFIHAHTTKLPAHFMGTWHCTWLLGSSVPGLTSFTYQLHRNILCRGKENATRPAIVDHVRSKVINVIRIRLYSILEPEPIKRGVARKAAFSTLTRQKQA